MIRRVKGEESTLARERKQPEVRKGRFNGKTAHGKRKRLKNPGARLGRSCLGKRKIYWTSQMIEKFSTMYLNWLEGVGDLINKTTVRKSVKLCRKHDVKGLKADSHRSSSVYKKLARGGILWPERCRLGTFQVWRRVMQGGRYRHVVTLTVTVRNVFYIKPDGEEKSSPVGGKRGSVFILRTMREIQVLFSFYWGGTGFFLLS